MQAKLDFIKEVARAEFCSLALILGIVLYGSGIFFALQSQGLAYQERFEIVNVDASVLPYRQELAAYMLSQAPDEVIKKLVDNGWSFLYVNEPIGDIISENNYTVKPFVEKEDAIGMTVFTEKKIIINMGYLNIANASLHEVAHAYEKEVAIENNTERASESKEFAAIFEKEKGFLPEYYQNDAGEFFAEATEIYWENPQRLKTEAPMTYEYLRKNIPSR